MLKSTLELVYSAAHLGARIPVGQVFFNFQDQASGIANPQTSYDTLWRPGFLGS